MKREKRKRDDIIKIKCETVESLLREKEIKHERNITMISTFGESYRTLCKIT